MKGTVRSLSALLVVLALVAGLPVTCLCAPVESRMPVADPAHDCCAPPAGVQADESCHECCGGTEAAVDAVPAAAPAVVAGVVVQSPLFAIVSAPAPAFARPAPAAAPSPPLVLRI
jgi:hypothetical protein